MIVNHIVINDKIENHIVVIDKIVNHILVNPFFCMYI